MAQIPINILAAMREAGGLEVKSVDDEGNMILDVNFKIIEQQFPSYLHEVVLQCLPVQDHEFFLQGYMAYLIEDDGSLIWKYTVKLEDLKERMTKNGM